MDTRPSEIAMSNVYTSDKVFFIAVFDLFPVEHWLLVTGSGKKKGSTMLSYHILGKHKNFFLVNNFIHLFHFCFLVLSHFSSRMQMNMFFCFFTFMKMLVDGFFIRVESNNSHFL